MANHVCPSCGRHNYIATCGRCAEKARRELVRQWMSRLLTLPESDWCECCNRSYSETFKATQSAPGD